MVTPSEIPAARARFVRDRLPPEGLFAGHEWRISPTPFSLGPQVTRELETLGRVLLQFGKGPMREGDSVLRWATIPRDPGAIQIRQIHSNDR